jgi:4-alpha-glucanotransferase
MLLQPFRLQFFVQTYPGRCPGLLQFKPFGLDSHKTWLNSNIFQKDILMPTNSLPTSRQWDHVGFKTHHGIVIPLFSLHSANSCGIGEYPDLIPVIHWCQSLGFNTIQLLPLNDTGDDTSPYNAISAFALNPIHIGLSSLPYLNDFPDLITALKKIQMTPSSPHIDYTTVRSNKMQFLAAYYKCVKQKTTSLDGYKNFISHSSWLKGYALFKALKKRFNNLALESWPNEWLNPNEKLLELLADQEKEELDWEFFLQYLCNLQLHHVKEEAEAKGISLMGDVPILVSRDSADIWLKGDLFLLNYSSGAPPDVFSIEGQNWGSPIYNWEHVEREQYQWWIDRVKCASRYYQIYRIDHILGFFRIWAIPKGLTCKEGHYISEDSSLWIPQGKKTLLALIQNCDMLPIGEDLGVIPHGVHETLSELGICGTKIMRWERDWHKNGDFIPPSHYPLLSMTSVSTHDSETLQLWWQENPLEAAAFAKFKKWDFLPKLSPEQHKEILYDSHHSGSLFHINLLQEYFVLIPNLTWPDPKDERINVPGTISEQNWSYRYRASLEEWIHNEQLANKIKEILSCP